MLSRSACPHAAFSLEHHCVQVQHLGVPVTMQTLKGSSWFLHVCKCLQHRNFAVCSSRNGASSQKVHVQEIFYAQNKYRAAWWHGGQHCCLTVRGSWVRIYHLAGPFMSTRVLSEYSSNFKLDLCVNVSLS